MSETARGLSLLLGAFIIWGLVFPLFFKILSHLPPVEVLAHRIVWAMPTALAILVLMRRTSDILPTFRSAEKMRFVAAAALTISINWGFYIYAIASENTLQASLGYFISPLITVALGFFVLGEPLSRRQKYAILLVAAGVFVQTLETGVFPWLSFILACTFGCYTLVKKTIPVGASQGFLLETVVVFPLAFGGLVWFLLSEGSTFMVDGPDTLLLILSGPLTAIPLIMFAAGARRISMTTSGLLMYLVPTMIFLTAVFIFKEPISPMKFVSFIIIWIALAVYSWPAGKRPQPPVSSVSS